MNGGPGKLVFGVSLKDDEWKNIEYWHTDPSGKSPKSRFYNWATETPTSDRSKGCDASKGGYTTCYIYVPAGTNAGWIGGEGSEGFKSWPGPDVAIL